MPDQLQLRGGTTTETNSFTGAAREVTVDTTKKTAVVHDGSTAGGNPLLREDGSNSALALGSQGTPSLKFTGDTNTGIYSPGADQVAISTGGSARLYIAADGDIGIKTTNPYQALDIGGTTSALIKFSPSNQGTTATDGGYIGHNFGGFDVWQYETNYMRFGTANTPRLYITSTGEFEFVGAGTAGTTQAVYFSGSAPVNSLVVDSNGRLGIGTSSPSRNLDIAAGQANVGITSNTTSAGNEPTLVFTHAGNNGYVIKGGSNLQFASDSGSNVRMTLTTAGSLGIGTTSPSYNLHVQRGASTGVSAQFGRESGSSLFVYNATTVSYLGSDSSASNAIGFLDSADAISFHTNDGAEKARIDSSGRLLVGTSTSSSNARVVLQGSTANTSGEAIIRFARGEATPADGASTGAIIFTDSTHGDGALINGARDGGTWSASSKPSRLVFSTTADGASSPTERMRIANDGHVLFNKTSVNSLSSAGVEIFGGTNNGAFFMTRNGNDVLSINRLTSDGVLVFFYQDTVAEGSISVSGTTVSYNGAHLSRWSQLPGGVERTEILRGSVLSNIDEMCGWGEEDNEQLNRMKVSDVEGDKNVSGVFQAWDDDDDTYTNDFYCAMTGDFIIRIAQGVTVERGDLLMSAGDGTAKPQDDDIIRSKTIAKVTSTNVSCTYDDGSYCVPCVLMAC